MEKLKTNNILFASDELPEAHRLYKKITQAKHNWPNIRMKEMDRLNFQLVIAALKAQVK